MNFISERKIEIKTWELVYWSCRIEGHRHRLQSVAEKCANRIDKTPSGRRYDDSVRLDWIVRYLNGESTSSIASTFSKWKVRPTRVLAQVEHVLYNLYRRMTPYPTGKWYGSLTPEERAQHDALCEQYGWLYYGKSKEWKARKEEIFNLLTQVGMVTK